MQILYRLIGNDFGIAFSGGIDSLVMAHRLRRFKPVLYHFNHEFIEEDDRIEDQVIEAANFLGLELIIRKSDEKYVKGSCEDFCRKSRYNWFSQVGGKLLTAHTLSDCTESYLMRCLAGHPEYTPIPVKTQFGKTQVVRPMVLVSRSSIEEYAIKNKLEDYVAHDPMNGNLELRRNWVRHKILPEIQSVTNLEKVVRKRYLKFLNELK
jgi:tRNA(Ile)-lysidine synthetase-like protein